MATKERLRLAKVKLTQKLADQKDNDDARWVKHRLVRVEKRLVKKEKAIQHKRQGKVGRNRATKQPSDS